MINKKALVGLVLTLVLVAAGAASVKAAPLDQTATITGTINSVSTTTDSSGSTVVVVTLTDSAGTTQTVDLSVDSAIALGLVTKNADGSITVNDVTGQSISIDQSTVLTDPCKSSEGAQQPVGKAITDFFCGPLGLDYSTVQTYHSDGFGYGEIAQACFMAEALGGNAGLCGSILDAKKSGDFSSLTLPNGDTPTNWGQLKKDVLSQEVKSLTNLGAIVSGRANSVNSSSDGGNVNNNAGKHGHGHGNGNGHGNGQGNGH